MSQIKEILDLLLKTIRNRDGEARVRQIQDYIKPQVMVAMNREIICQTVALERPWRRFRFFVLCPRLIVPYLMRIRKTR
jgi:hypothetical protein